MPSPHPARLQDSFADLIDLRRCKVVRAIINIAVIAGADDFVAIAARARQKRDWLARFLDLGGGIPSHDRFNAVSRAIDEPDGCFGRHTSGGSDSKAG